MIATIFIVSLAYLWLLYETDWLRINLTSSYQFTEFDLLDIESDFNGESDIYAEDFEIQHHEAIREWQAELDYQRWLDLRYAPKYSYGSLPESRIDPRDRWQDTVEKLTARRQGEMLYQRIR